jgi:hypothetical protein
MTVANATASFSFSIIGRVMISIDRDAPFC